MQGCMNWEGNVTKKMQWPTMGWRTMVSAGKRKERPDCIHPSFCLLAIVADLSSCFCFTFQVSRWYGEHLRTCGQLVLKPRLAHEQNQGGKLLLRRSRMKFMKQILADTRSISNRPQPNKFNFQISNFRQNVWVYVPDKNVLSLKRRIPPTAVFYTASVSQGVSVKCPLW